MKFEMNVLLGVLIAVASAADYCSETLCPTGDHIACGHSGGFSATCSHDAKIVKLKKDDIEAILRGHNRLRNKIASGAEAGFGPAAKMTTLVWNSELAHLAELNARSCVFQHDRCRSTEKHKYAGQNIALTSATGAFPDLATFLNSSISDWYSEVRDATQADIDKYPTTERVIGHMTQIVNDKSNEVGCAVVQFTEGEWKTSIITCDYARTNIKDFPIYKSGPAASKCSTGRNSMYTALCSMNEPVDASLI